MAWSRLRAVKQHMSPYKITSIRPNLPIQTTWFPQVPQAFQTTQRNTHLCLGQKLGWLLGEGVLETVYLPRWLNIRAITSPRKRKLCASIRIRWVTRRIALWRGVASVSNWFRWVEIRSRFKWAKITSTNCWRTRRIIRKRPLFTTRSYNSKMLTKSWCLGALIIRELPSLQPQIWAFLNVRHPKISQAPTLQQCLANSRENSVCIKFYTPLVAADQ